MGTNFGKKANKSNPKQAAWFSSSKTGMGDTASPVYVESALLKIPLICFHGWFVTAYCRILAIPLRSDENMGLDCPEFVWLD
jgi:hypothetical protein